MLKKTENIRGHFEGAETSDSSSSSRLPQPIKPPVKSSPLKFFASSSGPRFDVSSRTHRDWQANFLNDLRSNRPARPSGSRPIPERERPSNMTSAQNLPPRTSSAMSRPIKQTEGLKSYAPDRCSSAMFYRQVESDKPAITLKNGAGSLTEEASSSDGQPIVGGPTGNTAALSPTYRESGLRWMEKQEARSLREALEDMDLRNEKRLHEAAQDEASQLLWKHRNPNMPYRNPDATYDYRSHLRKGSHAKSQNFGRFGEIPSQHESRLPSSTSSSDNPMSASNKDVGASSNSSLQQSNDKSVDLAGRTNGHALWDSPQKRAYMSMTHPKMPSNRSDRRQSSGSKSRNASGGLFRNPNDQIYEEPDDLKVEARTIIDQPSGPLQVKPRNVVSNVQIAGQLPFRSATAPDSIGSKLSRSDIHKNPPSQSRNPSYMKNEITPASPASPGSNENESRLTDSVQTDAIEIRGEDIRAATSMRMRDRSPKLPSPTVVSDQRGRPIVSFDPNWKPREKEIGQGRDRLPPDGLHSSHHTRSAVSAPAVPTINFPEPLSPKPKEIYHNISTKSANPTISACSDIPSISVEEVPAPKRPLPHPNSARRSKTMPTESLDTTAPGVNVSGRHWSQMPSTRRTTAQCYACALPISGRIVSAASQRFHPQCFTCHQCSALLEHVAFYPEPDSSRDARLARIQVRATASDPNEVIEGKTAEDDGDESLRFYCHLDFHENFSPRCRNCKTPIEGEVVVACGGEWHVGHFFCAECGDPFDAKTPFVEREGYAWCVGCHTKRFSGKCKGCRKPVIDLVVRALGEEWHEECFCCKECGGGFEDGRFFTRGEEEMPVCVGCEERRLKA